MPSPEGFNPADPEYKHTADLPEEHQEDFVDLPEDLGGGFARREAADPVLQAKIESLAKDDPEILVQKLQAIEDKARKFQGTREEWLMQLGPNSCWLLKYAPDELRGDREFMLKVARERSIKALKYVSDDLYADRDFWLKASWHMFDALEYAPLDLRADRDFMLEAAKKHGWALTYALGKLRADRGLMLEVIREDISGSAFRAVPDELRNDIGFLIEIAKVNPKVLKYADASILAELIERSDLGR